MDKPASAGFFCHGRTHANPSALVTEDHYNRSAPGIPTEPDVANAHAQTMADALRSMADGDLPDVQPDVAQKIVDGVLPDPIHENAQALREAGLDDLPGFEAALADVPRQELPPESIPHYGASTTSDFMDIVGEAFGLGLIKDALQGHDGPVQRRKLAPEQKTPERAPDAVNVMLDDFHQTMLDHLVHNYGDAPFGGDYSLGIPEHDNFGRPITFKQAAALMQYRRNDAERFGAPHEVAAACAARNGFGSCASARHVKRGPQWPATTDDVALRNKSSRIIDKPLTPPE